jgi:hypothetical protein
VGGDPVNRTDPSGLYGITGVKGHDENGDEICNGVREVADNLNPDKNFIAQCGITSSTRTMERCLQARTTS